MYTEFEVIGASGVDLRGSHAWACYGNDWVGFVFRAHTDWRFRV